MSWVREGAPGARLEECGEPGRASCYIRSEVFLERRPLFCLRASLTIRPPGSQADRSHLSARAIAELGPRGQKEVPEPQVDLPQTSVQIPASPRSWPLK